MSSNTSSLIETRSTSPVAGLAPVAAVINLTRKNKSKRFILVNDTLEEEDTFGAISFVKRLGLFSTALTTQANGVPNESSVTYSEAVQKYQEAHCLGYVV